MKKTLDSSLINFSTFHSPGAPDYRERSFVVQKGWCSERVPAQTNSSRRLIGPTPSTPFDSGRTLPSKWEDAERWICSPNSGYGFGKELYSQESQRPKSKSGPLGPPGFSCNSTPATPAPEGGTGRNFLVGSPFSTGVMVPGRVLLHSAAGGEREVGRSGGKGPEWINLLSENSLPSCQDEKLQPAENTDPMNSPATSRRDMATQMSPESSSCSSTNGRFSFCPSPAILEMSDKPRELEQVRDVQVDKRTMAIGWSKRNGARIIKNGLGDGEDFDRNDVDDRSSSWNIAVASTDISKLQREEAKITAWENLQKAKAETAMRKLELNFDSDEIGKEEIIQHRQNLDQAKKGRDKSPRKEKFIVSHSHERRKRGSQVSLQDFTFQKVCPIWSLP